MTRPLLYALCWAAVVAVCLLAFAEYCRRLARRAYHDMIGWRG